MRTIDPTEWANRKKAAVERAKQLREERKNAMSENATFQPQLVARRGNSNSSLTNHGTRGDSLDRLTSEVSHDPMDLPLPALKNRNNPSGPRTGGAYSNDGYDNDQYQSLPSPGSDALGKEMKKHNYNSGNFSNGYEAPVPAQRQAGGKIQYQSKFLRQYDEDNNGILSGNARSTASNQPSMSQPHSQPPQKDPNEEFMNFLRSDNNSKSRSVGPGWNSDTTSSGFGDPPSSVKKAPRRERPLGEVVKASSAPRGALRGNSSDAYNDYMQTNDPHNRNIVIAAQRSVSQPSGDDYSAGFGGPKVSPRTAPGNNSYSHLGGGNGAAASPRDPVVKQARSSLSLLKSKIKQTESFNSSRSLKKSLGGESSFADSDNERYEENHGYSYSSSSRNTQSVPGRSQSNTNNYGIYEPSANNNARSIPQKPSMGNNTSYEPSVPQQRGSNGRGPIPSHNQSRNVSKPSYQPPVDSDEEENVVVMVPRKKEPNHQYSNNNYPPNYNTSNGNIPRPSSGRNASNYDYPASSSNVPSTKNHYQNPAPVKNTSHSDYPPLDDEYGNEGMDDANLPQEECPDCGRKFNQNAFEKHVKICKKVFMQKRKKFDSTKQRLQGDGVDPELKKVYEKANKEETRAQRGGRGGGGGGMALKHNDQPVGGKGGGGGGGDSKWKQQSQAFREAMKAARDYNKAKERGEEPPPPVISAPDPSLIPCPHCGRRFNEMAANRHIPQCKNIKAKPTSLKKGGGINAAVGVNAGRSKR